MKVSIFVVDDDNEIAASGRRSDTRMATVPRPPILGDGTRTRGNNP